MEQPLKDQQWDVVVAGGGPAGCAAAAAAAEEGMRTLLIERTGVLGGMGTSGLLATWCPFTDGERVIYRGLALRIFEESRRGCPHVPPQAMDWVPINAEHLKRVYDDLIAKSGCSLLLHSHVAGVTHRDRIIQSILVANKNGLSHITSKFFIDATGDGDVCAWSDCTFEHGDCQGEVQPASLCFILSNVNLNSYYSQSKPSRANLKDKIDFNKYHRLQDLHISNVQVGPNAIGFNAGHLWKIDGTNSFNVTQSMIDGRKIAMDYWQALVEYLPDTFKDSYLSHTASIPGIRESRRIMGDYILSIKDYIKRNTFSDDIAINAYPIDIHPSEKDKEKLKKEEMDVMSQFEKYRPGEFHGIPYRCLCPKDMDNLLVAGRCISTDRIVQASTRVMPVALVLGEAAGVAGALACKGNGRSREVDVDALRARLIARGAYLPTTGPKAEETIRPPLPQRGILQAENPLLPEVHCFNPALLFGEAGPIAYFRSIAEDGERRILRTRLNESFLPEGPLADWSREVKALTPGLSWVADPRAFRFRGGGYITINTGHSEQPNRIYVVEVDRNGAPTGPALEAIRTDGRRSIEKNWGFFEHEGMLYAVYSLSPLEILRCRFEDGHLLCEPAFMHHWHSAPLEAAFGPLHGGAGPLQVAGRLILPVQSRTRDEDGYVYRGSLMELEPTPPFGPLAVAPEPLFDLEEDERELQPRHKPNPAVARVLYPSGLDIDPRDGSAVLTYGINDYRAAFRRYPPDALFQGLKPITRLRTLVTAATELPEAQSIAPPPLLRTFFWNPSRFPGATPDDLAQGRFRHGNVGDSMQAHLVAQLFGASPLHLEREGGRLLGVGSIAHRALPGDVIWGSGFKPVPLALSPEAKARIDVRAVRGPLTLDYLAAQGLDVSRVGPFFDPGLLVREIFPEQVAACRSQAPPPSGILLVPHYTDTPGFLSRWGSRHPIRTVDCDLFTFLTSLLGAELVLSSSLHGVILAEALGVPALLLRPPSTETALKYEDYYRGTGRDRFPILEDPSEASRVRIPDLPPLPRGWRATLPRLEGAHALLTEPVITLQDASVSPPIQAYRQGRLHLDPGRFLGSWFQLRVLLALDRAVRVRVTAGGQCLHESTCHPGSGDLLQIGLDGALIEALGGRFCLDFTASAGGFAWVRSLLGRPA